MSEIETLNQMCWDAIAERRDIVTGKEIIIPAPVPLGDETEESRHGEDFPVLQHLDTAVALAQHYELAEIATRFHHLARHLRWSQNPAYTIDNCDPSLLNGYAYAACAGPEGPIYTAAPRGGLALFGPNVTYPPHNHAPREVYLVLTPGAQWQLDEGEWFDVQAGQLIYHDTWQAHAMRTLDKPLLAYAGWIEPGSRASISWVNSAVSL